MHKISLLVMLLFVLTSSSECTKSKAETEISFTVIRDVTDSNISFPKSDEVRPFFRLEKNKWIGIDFRLTYIADVEYGPEHNVDLPGRNSLLSNELERKKEIEIFLKEVDTALNHADRSSKDYSVVFPVVIREIKRLAENKRQGTKILAIYSDLIENTDLVSFIKNPVKSMKGKDNELIWKKLETKYDVSLDHDLSSLKVYFVYQAKDISSSHEFSVLSHLYKEKLEKMGASVHITANL